MINKRLVWIGLASITLLSLTGCDNGTSSVEDLSPEVTQDTLDEDIELREGSLNQSYETEDNTIKINKIALVDFEGVENYVSYQGVRVNATITNDTDETQAFDVWSQLRVGSVRDRDSFGALQLSTYGLDDFDTPEMNDDLFIEIEAGESVTYDFLFDVIVPEDNDDDDIKVIYQINPTNHYDQGYIVWDIDGFTDLEPSDVEEFDWDSLYDEEGNLIEDAADDVIDTDEDADADEEDADANEEDGEDETDTDEGDADTDEDGQ